MCQAHAMSGPSYGRAGWFAMTGPRGHRRNRSYARWGGGPFAFGPPGPRFGPRARRGDIRAAILALLAEEPRNGYQIIQELEQRSDGIWRPSPGAVYPALSQLEDEGLVRTIEVDGRRAFELSDAGRAAASAREGERAPWETVGDSVADGVTELRDLAFQLGAALMQVAHSGSEENLARAREIVSEARRSVYRLLSEDEK